MRVHEVNCGEPDVENVSYLKKKLTVMHFSKGGVRIGTSNRKLPTSQQLPSHLSPLYTTPPGNQHLAQDLNYKIITSALPALDNQS